MFYKRDFVSFRARKSKLQIFPGKVHNRREKKDDFRKFAENFTLNGFCYIFHPQLHKFERYLWAICVTSAIIVTGYICSVLSGKYSDHTIITVIEDSQYPVFKVPFPAVALCTKHRINWARVEKARWKFLPPEADNATIEMFTNFIKRMDSLQFRTFETLAGLEEEPLHLINSISVTALATYLAFRCTDVIYGTCIWDGKPMDCCKHFIQERTLLGVCLVFNSVISDESRQKADSDEFYPYRVSQNGEGTGLIFSVQRNRSNVVPGGKVSSGFEIMIKHADQWSDEITFNLRPNTHTAVLVQPELTEAHDNLITFHRHLRKCLFQFEKAMGYHIQDLAYRKWNCRTKCRQNYVEHVCNCTIPLFFSEKRSRHRECTPSDYICIYKNRDVFSTGFQPNMDKYMNITGREMSCPCPPSCESVKYATTINMVPFMDDLNSKTSVNIFYQSDVMMKYVTKLKFTMLDLTAYFGGIVALLVGASLLTGVELLYYALLQLVSYLRRKLHKRKTVKKIAPMLTHI